MLDSKKANTKGIHLIGDLYNCDLSEFVAVEAELPAVKENLFKLISSHRLEVLGSYFHFFGPHAVTATICLAESHINFHTWPESRLVTLDVFVCSYTQDNNAAAETIYEQLVGPIFRAGEVRTNRVYR